MHEERRGWARSLVLCFGRGLWGRKLALAPGRIDRQRPRALFQGPASFASIDLKPPAP
jgi:hypothetical protein